MDEELDYGEEDARLDSQQALQEHLAEEDADALAAQQDAADHRDSALHHDVAGRGHQPLQQQPNGSAGGGGAHAAVPAPGDHVPEDWQVMDVPDEWRPRPMVRVWGLPAAATEAELADLLEAQGLPHAVRSVVFDPRQATQAGKVALVRFQPPPSPSLPAELGAPAPPEPDVGKIAEGLIASLRAKAPELHGVKINVEKTGAEVCLFLANLRGEAETDEGLRAICAQHGDLERCFVVRNPSGDSKGYAFVEFTLPSAAAACKEAWNKAGEAQRPQRDAAATDRQRRVKLQRAEAAPVRSVAGLFATVLYVDGMQPSFTNYEALKRIFAEYGEVTSCYMPRSPTNPSVCRGFAFVQFKHSFAADAAYRALDDTDHPGIGRLLISFSNPVKASDQQQRAAAGTAGAGQPRQQQQQRTAAQGARGDAGGGRAGSAVGGRPPPPAVPPPRPMVPSGMMGMPGAPIILPASGMPAPPPPPPPPNALLMQQQQQQAAAMQQVQAQAMQQRLAMQQMMMMQQQPWLAMQQALMQQQAAAAEEIRAKQAELEAAAHEAERRRKEAEEKAAAEEKARREAEYAARLGYGLGMLPGMTAPGALGGLAGNPMAAMAAAAGLPGFGAAFSGLGAGLASGMAGLGGTVDTRPSAGAGSGAAAAEAGRSRPSAGGGYGADVSGGGYEEGGEGAYEPYRGADMYGGQAGSRGGSYGGNRGGGGGGGSAYGGRRGGDSGYGGGSRYGRGGEDGYGYGGDDGYGGGTGGGRSAGDGYGGSRGGQGKRSTDHSGGGYSSSYGYAPKRPRY